MTDTTPAEPVVTKRRVTGVGAPKVVGVNEDGTVITTAGPSFTDYVRPDHLDAYVADAEARGWFITVSAEPDAGPNGYHGPTHVPAYLDLPDAGVTYPHTYEEAGLKVPKSAQPAEEN